MAKTFTQFLVENSELEQYRKSTLITLRALKDEHKRIAEHTLGVKIHKVHPIGSITSKSRFKETSDVDVAFHYSDKSKPEGLDSDASEKLQNTFFRALSSRFRCNQHSCI